MNTMVADALVGRTVDRRYRVESRLATGGMATVYLATDLRLDRPVALKVMKPGLVYDVDFVTRFEAEAKAAARLSHPNVVAVFDQGAADGVVYLAMEYVPGQTLRDVLREYGHLPAEQALWVLDQALQALEAAHRAGFLHRDIKPENVLVSDSGIVKVTDFGLTRALATPSSATRGMLIGTAAYLAPEQVSDGHSDERSDVYQAGVLLYELLTGAPPHAGESPWAVAYQHVNADVPRVSASQPQIDPDLDRLVADATARDRNRRIPSVPEFLRRLRAVALRLPPPAPFPRRTAVLKPPVATSRPDPGHPADVLPLPPLAAPDDPDAVASHARAERPPVVSTGRSRRRAWIVGSVVMLLLVLIAGGAGWVAANGNPFDRTDVPTVVGATETKAMAALRSAGFAAEVSERRFSEEVPAGIVIASDPEQGAGAQTGSTVGLVVSMGPERYEVPKLRGEPADDAAAQLTATNLVVAEQRQIFDDTVDEGQVVRTSPKAGTRVKRDTPVTMFVSKGPAPVEMPDLTGLTGDQAREKLRQAGLQVQVSREESTTVPQNGVISFSPKPGTMLHRGDSVAMVLSKGPPPVTVPNVVDMPRDEAVARLEALGFRVQVSEGVLTPLGRVYEQDPTGGTVAPAGSTVTLSIF